MPVDLPSREVFAAIFNVFMFIMLSRFTMRLVQRPARRRLRQTSFRQPTPRHAIPSPSPLEIAQERYAQGEIDAEEFEQLVEHLLKSRAPSQDW